MKVREPLGLSNSGDNETNFHDKLLGLSKIWKLQSSQFYQNYNLCQFFYCINNLLWYVNGYIFEIKGIQKYFY